MFFTWLDEHNGEWLKAPDENGKVPLHNALVNYSNGNTGVPTAVTLALLAACPEAAKVKNTQGRTPLQYRGGNKKKKKRRREDGRCDCLPIQQYAMTVNITVHAGPNYSAASMLLWMPTSRWSLYLTMCRGALSGIVPN